MIGCPATSHNRFFRKKLYAEKLIDYIYGMYTGECRQNKKPRPVAQQIGVYRACLN